MLNIDAIKKALIYTNELMFQGKHPEKLFNMHTNTAPISLSKSNKKDRNYHPLFLRYWYQGTVYDETINEMIDRLIESETNKTRTIDSNVSLALSAISKSYATKKNPVDRNPIYVFLLKRLTKSDTEDIINNLANNIHYVIKNNCDYRSKPLPQDHIEYAQNMLKKLNELINNYDDDTIPDEIIASMKQRIELFHLNNYSEEGECAYKKLAIISLIALIPNDPNNDEMQRIIRFSYEFNRRFEDIIKKEPIKKNDNCVTSIATSQNTYRDLIKAAWKTWYQCTKNEGSHFSLMFSEYGVDKEILPLVSALPINVHQTNEEDVRLLDFISSTTDHLYIIGDGGIGKTTSLYSIMESVYGENSMTTTDQIPIYIELSKASKSDVRDNMSRFIHNSIFDQVETEIKKHNTISVRRDELEKEIVELFVRENSIPEYVLLLDGLNEVSRENTDEDNAHLIVHSIVERVIGEITYILNTYKNVRVILTSRSVDLSRKDVKTLYLSGVSEEIIENFLKDKIASPRLTETLENKQLMEILRIPLFLTMYARIESDITLLSRGEILHTFFTQKKDGLYSERNIRIAIEKEAYDKKGEVRSYSSITSEMLGFMLDFILPTIAWYMVIKGNENSISPDEIKECIIQVLTDDAPTAWIGSYGKKCFTDYRDINKPYKSIVTVAETMESLGKGRNNKWDNIAETVCDCLEKQLGILTHSAIQISGESVSVYKFIHQHIRDYFAALYHINKLKLAAHMNKHGENKLAISCLCEWRKPLPGQVLTFIGESLGEVHNAPKYNNASNTWDNNILDSKENDRNSRTLVMRCLDIYRHRYYGDNNVDDGFAVWNLFQILKLVRKDLSGIDLSYLDLTKCRANGYRLANKNHPAVLKGSKLNELFFLATGHCEWINDSSFSKDGQYIVTSSDDKTCIIWNTKTFEEVSKLKGHTRKVLSSHFSNDRNDTDGVYRIVTASADGTSVIWKWDEQKQESVLLKKLSVSEEPVNTAQFSEDNRYILTVSNDGKMFIWDAENYLSVYYKHFDFPIKTACFSNSDKGTYQIITTSHEEVWNAKIWMWNPDTNADEITLIDTLQISEKPVNSIQFSRDQKYIVSASDDNLVRLWEFDGKKYIFKKALKGHKSAVNSAQFSSNGKLILSSSSDNSLRIWSTETFGPVPNGEFYDSHHDFWSASFSSNGKFIVANTHREAIILDAMTLSVVPGGVLKSNHSDIFSAMYSPDGNHIILGCRESTAKVWNSNTFKVEPDGLLKGHNHSVYSAKYSPNGMYIITSSGDRTAKIWDAKTFQEMDTLEDHTDYVHDAQFSNDESIVVTVSKDHTAKVWKHNQACSKYKLTKTLNGHSSSINMVSFSPDSKYFITSSADGKALIWNTKSPYNQVKVKKPIQSDTIMESAVFSPKPNGIKKILTADHNGNVKLWEAESPFNEVADGILSNGHINRSYASFSPDERKVVIASWDGYALVFEWNKKKNKYEMAKDGYLNKHTSCISTAVFSPDKEGRFILTCSWDNTAIIWDSKTYKPLHTLHSKPGLEIWGIDLTNLYDINSLDKETWRILDEYGSLVDPNLLLDDNITVNPSKKL